MPHSGSAVKVLSGPFTSLPRTEAFALSIPGHLFPLHVLEQLLKGSVSAGPGAFDFKQGDTNGTLFWKVVGRFLKDPNQEQIDCQAPKPILLDTGEVNLPYAW